MAIRTTEELQKVANLSELLKLTKADKTLWSQIKYHMGDPSFEELYLVAEIPGGSWECSDFGGIAGRNAQAHQNFQPHQ